MNPYFTHAEYMTRHARAMELMHARELSALFVTSDRNLYYLSGHQPVLPWVSNTRPTVLILPRDRNPVLISHDVWHGAAVRDSWIKDVRRYSELDGIPMDMIASVFHELNIDHGRMGGEFGIEQRLGMPLSDFNVLRNALPQAQWVDAADLLWTLRLIKSTAEIDCIRAACSAVGQAFASIFPTLRPGLTQEEVVHMLQAAVCTAGADFGFAIPTWGSATNVALGCLPSSDPIAVGDFIWVDMGAVYHGYWCDFCRAVSLGQPSDVVMQTWESVHAVTMRGVERTRPGVTLAEVTAACGDEAEKRGLGLNFAAGRLGHSIGLMPTEPPGVTLRETTILEPGMTITLEPGIVDETGVFVVEQNVVVTEDGSELLSLAPWQICIS